MPPSRIILIRHGERVDKKNPSFARTAERPHDPPLTEAGKEMARSLGKYLIEHLHIDRSNVVVLSSPLIRCIQTADGIISGMSHICDEALTVPIYCETGVMEGGNWLMKDMQRNPSIWTEDYFHCPQPLFYPPEYLHENISQYVEQHKPFDFNVAPELVITDHFLREEKLSERCSRAARALLQCPELDNKVVLVVGHGETVILWNNAIVEPSSVLDLDMENPAYTSIMALSPQYSELLNNKDDNVSASVENDNKIKYTCSDNAGHSECNERESNKHHDYTTNQNTLVKSENNDTNAKAKVNNDKTSCTWVNEWPTFYTPHLRNTPSEY